MGDPFLADQPERQYFGIRFSAPYRNLFSVAAGEFRKLDLWIQGNNAVEWGPRFLRYRVIDMRGTMELEVGVFGGAEAPLEGVVSKGTLPGGRYATLIYRGLGLAANKRLLQWIETNGFRSDRTGTPQGDAFACRYEAYLTDPKTEPRKKQWDIELAIKLA